MDLSLIIGHACEGNQPPGRVTVDELRMAITKERTALDAVIGVLRDEDPQKIVSEALVGRIRELYPTLRWKR